MSELYGFGLRTEEFWCGYGTFLFVRMNHLFLTGTEMSTLTPIPSDRLGLPVRTSPFIKPYPIFIWGRQSPARTLYSY